MKICLIVILLVIPFAGCRDGTESPGEPAESRRNADEVPGKIVGLFGGVVSVNTVKDAAIVKAYRLRQPSYHHKLLSEYEMVAGPVDVSDAVATELRGLLFDPSSYDWASAKGGIPDYGVCIQFTHDASEVNVLFCFSCDILAVYYQGKLVEGVDFDKIRPQLVAIVKQLFPEDRGIQALE